MIYKISIPAVISILLMFTSCSAQESHKENPEIPSEEPEPQSSSNNEPHRYGGWYCPDNFGFVPVDIAKLGEVPAISDRLPTEQEVRDSKSLIKVDKEKYPDARALEMDLPRVARIYSRNKGMDELIIVIQAIVVQEDTVVGYRFPNGGNGSGWMRDVTFLSSDEVVAMGSQPFFYSKSTLNASTKDIWRAAVNTKYFKQLGKKFNQKEFFSSSWNPESVAHLSLDTDEEKASGYVGMVYGNYYLQIDYNRGGLHFSEKMLMVENHEEQTTEFFFASGPYTEDFSKQESKLSTWIESIKKDSEAD